MNTQIGKSIGIALLLAVGAIAVMLAWSPFIASAAHIKTTPPPSAVAELENDGEWKLVVTFQVATDITTGGMLAVTLKGVTADAGSIATLEDTSIDEANITDNNFTFTVVGNNKKLASASDSVITITGLTEVRVGATVTLGDQEIEVTAKSGSILAVVPTGPPPCPGDNKATNSCTAGAAVRIELTGTFGAVAANEGIVIKLPKFGVPSTITNDSVIISDTDKVDVASENPSDITVSGTTVTVFAKDGLLTVTSIIIKEKAGITNPTKAKVDYEITIDPPNAADITIKVDVQREVKVDPIMGAGGASVTVTGTGFTDGSATVYIENGGNINYDAAGADKDASLGTAEITDGAFTLTTTGITEDSKVNAVDGAGDEAVANVAYDVTASISVTATEISLAETLTITLNDWTMPTGKPQVFLGGTEVLEDVVRVDEDTVTVVVPETRLGTLTLKVTQGEDLDSTNITVSALSLTVSPSVAVPGQEITIRGSGFDPGERFYTSDDDDDTNDGTVKIGVDDALDAGEERAVSNGDVSIEAQVPWDTDPGDLTVKITGSKGRVGSGTITVPKPAVTFDPPMARRGESVDVSGTGFPARDFVQLYYANADVTDGFAPVPGGNAATDSEGSFNATFIVPNFADIGATQDVQVRSQLHPHPVFANVGAKFTTPDPEINVSPTTAEAGGSITVSGVNFAGFENVTELTIGNVDRTPIPSTSTDGSGSFTTPLIQVPQLDPGQYRVRIQVGGASSGNEEDVYMQIVAAVAVVETDPAKVFADLGDRLVRVWYLDSATQTWSFYDPDPEVAAFNSLTEVNSGQIVTVIASAGDPVEFQGTNLYAGTNNVALD